MEKCVAFNNVVYRMLLFSVNGTVNCGGKIRRVIWQQASKSSKYVQEHFTLRN